MNIIFGCISEAGTRSAMLRASGSIGDWFDQTSSLYHFQEAQLAIGSTDDQGVVLGIAETDDILLLYIGALQQPLPEWDRAGSPLDNPNTTANYLLDRYRNHGQRFLDRIFGQYSVVLYNTATGQLLLATDPSAQRAWYFREHDNGLSFSTHLRVLGALLGPGLKIDRSLEDFFLLYGFYPWGRTPYQGVRTLVGGDMLRYQAGRSSIDGIRAADPWEARPLGYDPGSVSEVQLIDALYDAFMTALEEQLADDGRSAVLLGGFDSALVAAGLTRLGKKVETFSFYYENETYNQPHAETVARFLGITHNWVPITREIFQQGVERFSLDFNQPTNWPNYVIQTAWLCSFMRSKGYRYCYSGDGCDTVFLGYPGTYKRTVLFESLPRLPQWFVKILLRLFARPFLDRAIGHPYRVFLTMIRSLGLKMPERGYLSFRIFDEISLAQLRRDVAPSQEKPLDVIVRELSMPHRGLPSLRLAYLGKSSVSPNKNKMVGSSDQNGMAILSPYMHIGMKNFAAGLPEEMCRPKHADQSRVIGKHILMRMAEAKKLLPREVIYQPKVAAVDGPIDIWYSDSMRLFVKQQLKNLPFDWSESYVDSLLRIKRSETLFQKYLLTDKVISHATSLLLTYASFCKTTEAD